MRIITGWVDIMDWAVYCVPAFSTESYKQWKKRAISEWNEIQYPDDNPLDQKLLSDG